MKNYKEQFIKKSNKVHNNKYNYSLVKYKNSSVKVEIICTVHGPFLQTPGNHMRGQGCPKCAGVKLSTKEEFIKKGNKKHNNTYGYSLVKYKNNKTKVKIICPEHGVFEQRPDNHLHHGCPKCANNILYTNEDFIKKANKIHNNKYDYSLVKYKTAQIKVKIICPEHSVFEQRPYAHLFGYGCSKCSGNYNYTNEEFIEKVNKIHNNIYDYSLVKYKNSNDFIKIICTKHGIFKQIAGSHLQGFGCKKCYDEKRKYDTEKFNELAKEKHGNLYDYSLVDYQHSNKKVKIICNKHGIFEQNAGAHLRGVGCPVCKSSRGERDIKVYLEKYNIKFEFQKTFDDCKNINHLPFDFYLPKYNICIEYDGMQHFKPIEYFGGEKTLKITKNHDNIKNDYCKNNNIKLLRIKYNENVINKLNFYFLKTKKQHTL